jgi:hypothetical protein
MKKRLAKKQIKKVIGFTLNGEEVMNFVTNADYNGGSTKDEDYYRFEVSYIRKRYGKPLLLKNRWAKIYEGVLN